MKQHEDTAPLLKMGATRTHLKLNQSGKYSYYGIIPPSLNAKEYDTLEEGLDDFAAHIKALPLAKQKEIIGGLRPDIFAKVLTNYKEVSE